MRWIWRMSEFAKISSRQNFFSYRRVKQSGTEVYHLWWQNGRLPGGKKPPWLHKLKAKLSFKTSLGFKPWNYTHIYLYHSDFSSSFRSLYHVKSFSLCKTVTLGLLTLNRTFYLNLICCLSYSLNLKKWSQAKWKLINQRNIWN